MKIPSDQESDRENVDVRALMAEIRARVKNLIGESRDSRLPFVPRKGDDSGGERKAGELLHSEELRYLNQHHHYPLSTFQPQLITSHRRFVGPFITKFKRKVLSFLWQGLFRPYFEAEREYQSNLVRLLNDMTKYVDSRDSFIFWDLIKKIDYDLNKAMDRIERIGDDQAAALLSSERRIFGVVNEADAQIAAQLKTIEGVARGLERIVASISRKEEQRGADQVGQHSGFMHVNSANSGSARISHPDYSYLLLENRYRGSEADIKERLSVYPEYFMGAAAPILEIGGGRGELQELLKENGIASYGVEMDPAMVDASTEKGLNVQLGDGIAHLESLPDSSLGGVIAIQVIEHLDQGALKRLVCACLKKIKPGGKVIFETINTNSVVALARNYFRDPTHVFPLHPETMSFMLNLSGLKVLEVRKLSPFSEDVTLQEIEMRDFRTPSWSAALETLNHNIRRLNGLLYGHQDYCIVAEV